MGSGESKEGQVVSEYKMNVKKKKKRDKVEAGWNICLLPFEKQSPARYNDRVAKKASAARLIVGVIISMIS